ncbi:hypothetical protein QR680_005575 [Steinernema hermaphroditum]|uniref:G-protein coupled receptors family 1 profile domain-containing protein n=1 Tax=Steinernema hermaphroditum TaxID=289476 RepID=A0AA39LVX6_9BILA|nr:hypothetical protein QR680_005575 [Steinernema hermaphroditum]
MEQTQTTLYSIELQQPDSVQLVASYLCSIIFRKQSENGTGLGPWIMPDLYCAENPIKHPLILQVFVATVFSLIIIMSLIGNGVVMWIIIGHKVMKKPFNIFLFNLALSDCLNSVFNAGTTWPYNLYYRWWFGRVFCSINIFVGVVPTCVSVFTMMVVSFDRYRAVVNPLKARPSSNKKTFLILLLIWLAAIFVGILPAYYSQMTKVYFYSNYTQQVDYHWMCSIQDYEYRNMYEQMIMLVQYVIPLIVLVFTYGRVMWVFRKHNCQLGEERSLRKQKKAVKLILTVVVSFMVCWLPYQLYHAVLEGLMSNFKVASTCYLISYWVAMANSAINPIIYCYVNKRFRIGFRYAFRWLPCISYSQREYESSELFPERKALIDRSILHKQSGLRPFPTNHCIKARKRTHIPSFKKKCKHPDEATVYIESLKSDNHSCASPDIDVEAKLLEEEAGDLHLLLSQSSSSHMNLNDNDSNTQNFLVLIAPQN